MTAKQATNGKPLRMHVLVAINNGNVTEYYVNQSEVSQVRAYIDERDN